MAKNPKYPQDVTEEDKKILDNAIILYAVKFYSLTQEYPNPEDYARKVVLKRLRSNKDTAILYTVAYAKTSSPEQIFKPGEINQKLINDLRNTIQQDYIDSIREGTSHPDRFLDPRDLREGVLKKLQSHGIFIHMGKKGIIGGHERKNPGKKSSDDVEVDRGGTLSEYRVSEQIEKIKVVIGKPDALDYLYRRLIESGLVKKLAKYKMLAFLHAAKMDELVLHRMMGLGAAFMQGDIREKDTANFKVIFERLQLLNDSQLEQIADSIANNLIVSPWYYNALLFITALLKF